jgi:hypothetical protein
MLSLSLYHASVARVGDQERDRTATALKEHYVRGRLSVEELTDRLELALAARRDADVRRALDDLPSPWRPEAVVRRAKRAAVVLAVWLLWCVVSLVLLVGFVVAVAVQGLTWTNALLFPALWLGCTLLARRA